MKREEAVEIVLNKQYEFPYEYFKKFLEYQDKTEINFLS